LYIQKQGSWFDGFVGIEDPLTKEETFSYEKATAKAELRSSKVR
jgi:hypothetical protein